MSKQQRSDQLKKSLTYKHACKKKRSIAVAILYKIEGQNQRAKYSIETRAIGSLIVHIYVAERNMIDFTRH